MTVERRGMRVMLATVALLAACLVVPVDATAETSTPACVGVKSAVFSQCQFVADGSRPTVVGNAIQYQQRFILDHPYVLPEELDVRVLITRPGPTEWSRVEVVRCDGSGLSAASCSATADVPVEAGTVLTCSFAVSPATSPGVRNYACGNFGDLAP